MLNNMAWYGIEIVNIIAVIIKSMHTADDVPSIDEKRTVLQPASVTIKFLCSGQIFGIKISKNLSTYTQGRRKNARVAEKIDGKRDGEKNKRTEKKPNNRII